MRKLFLHIGTEKTGSTSIQKFVTKNCSVLLPKYGILWPKNSLLFSNNGHFPIAGSFLEPKERDFVPQELCSNPQTISSTLAKTCEISNPEMVVLSAEHFSSRFRECHIRTLSNALQDFDVKVIVYVRRQDNMALSYFSTGVRYGRREWFSSNEVKPSVFIYNLRGLIDSWAKYFGKQSIIVREFERSQLTGGDVVIDFLSILKIGDLSGLCTTHLKENEALTIKQLKFLVALNKRLPTWKEAAHKQDEQAFNRAQQLREIAISALQETESFSGSTDISNTLSTQARHEILNRFKKDNDYIAENYLGKPELFGDAVQWQCDSSHTYKAEKDLVSEADIIDVYIKSLEGLDR